MCANLWTKEHQWTEKKETSVDKRKLWKKEREI